MTHLEHLIATVRRVADGIWSRSGCATELWCGQAVYLTLAEQRPTNGYEHHASRTYWGMRVYLDRYLPPDVWRLADEHGTLLYDCREGRPLG